MGPNSDRWYGCGGGGGVVVVVVVVKFYIESWRRESWTVDTKEIEYGVRSTIYPYILNLSCRSYSHSKVAGWKSHQSMRLNIGRNDHLICISTLQLTI